MLKLTDKKLKDIIKKLLGRFHNEFAMKPVIGLEIEFYIDTKSNIDLIKYALRKAKLNCNLVNETGKNQYEIQLPHSVQILSKLDNCNKIKKAIRSKIAKNNKAFLTEILPIAIGLSFVLLT